MSNDIEFFSGLTTLISNIQTRKNNGSDEERKKANNELKLLLLVLTKAISPTHFSANIKLYVKQLEEENTKNLSVEEKNENENAIAVLSKKHSSYTYLVFLNHLLKNTQFTETLNAIKGTLDNNEITLEHYIQFINRYAAAHYINDKIFKVPFFIAFVLFAVAASSLELVPALTLTGIAAFILITALAINFIVNYKLNEKTQKLSLCHASMFNKVLNPVNEQPLVENISNVGNQDLPDNTITKDQSTKSFYKKFHPQLS